MLSKDKSLDLMEMKSRLLLVALPKVEQDEKEFG